MKEIERKDTREISGGYLPPESGEGGCTGPFIPKDYPDNPSGPYVVPDPTYTDPVE